MSAPSALRCLTKYYMTKSHVEGNIHCAAAGPPAFGGARPPPMGGDSFGTPRSSVPGGFGGAYDTQTAVRAPHTRPDLQRTVIRPTVTGVSGSQP